MGHGRRTDDTKPTVIDLSWLLSHACRIDERSLKIIVLLLASIAFLVSLGRFVLFKRSAQGAELQLDNGLIIFATLCLLVETGCVYSYTSMLYLIDGNAFNNVVNTWAQNNIDSDVHKKLSVFKPNWIVASSTLAWISIFSIKFSLLAFFTQFTRNISKSLRFTFRTTLGITAVSGTVILILQFTRCPHFDQNASKCLIRDTWKPILSIIVVEQLSNLTTTYMIICLFTLQLRKSHIALNRNMYIAISVVVCLTCLCIALGISRAAVGIRQNIQGVKQMSVVWNSLMLHCEAAISVMAGSMVVIYQNQHRRTAMYTTEDTDTRMSFSTRLKSAMTVSTRTALRLPPDTQTTIKDEVYVCSTPPRKDFGTPLRSADQFRCSLDESDFASSGDIADEGRHHIMVTVECTIVSEEASLNEVERAREDAIGRDWEWEQETEESSTLPSGSVRAGLLADIDPALIGMIASGIR